MTRTEPKTLLSGGAGRYSLLALALVLYMVVAGGTRLVLAIVNLDQIGASWPAMAPALALGMLYDLLTGLTLLLPFGLFLLIVGNRFLARPLVKWWVILATAIFFYAVVYLGVVEYFFFGEFSARFNSVAVDYLIFPHEVFVNLWDTYPVWQVLVAVSLLTVAVIYLLIPKLQSAMTEPTPRKDRIKWFAFQLALVTIGIFAVGMQPRTFSDNRVVNELAMNGMYSFAIAALTSELDYDTYYARMDDDSALSHAREELSESDASFITSGNAPSVDRLIDPPAPSRKLNVVIVLEESFGSRFIRSLDSTGPGCAPRIDELAQNGVLFTNIYATGNRTVRGMEAVLASFPPIPGQSVVRRPGGEHIFALPSLLKELGYQTSFIYGGYSYFDNMGAFMSANGCDRVIDRTDLAKKTFTTIWGVCDEDLFDNSLAILDTMHANGRPFFSLILTVSNHSPYTFPDGRIDVNPNQHTRENAVRYADYSLAKFLHDAESHPFFDSTLFVVLGDHGARVYGSQQIPMNSYRIPVLFYAPKILPQGVRINSLGSQIDVAPTIMGVLGQPYESQFFGHDLLSAGVEERALMSHNRDVAMLRGDHMAVLGLQQTVDLWHRDPLTGEFSPMAKEQDTALVDDAIGIYQTAYYLYKHRLLHPLPQNRHDAL